MRILFLFFYLSFFPFSILAEDPYIPNELQSWVPWVEQQNPEWGCAFSDGDSHCVFPGKINYQLETSRALFELDVELLKKGKVRVPSSDELKPEELVVRSSNGETIYPKTISSDKKIEMFLPKGEFKISGFFSLKSAPKELPLPENIGIWSVNSFQGSLQNQGSYIKKSRFKRKGNKLVKINQNKESLVDSLNIKVFRKIRDGSPLKITTLFQLNISGSSRSLEIENILPAGSIPTSVKSPLSYYLNSKGKLSLQLAPGKHEISIDSVMQQPVKAITLPKLNFKQASKIQGTDREIIIFKEKSRFRSVKVSGVTAASETAFEIPDKMKGGAVYVASSGGSVKLEEVRRGILKAQENSLNIKRDLWVNLNGKGFTAVDHIIGQMNSSFRLNALKETKLGRADSDGQPLLVTQDPINKAWGVEIDKNNLSLKTVSKYETSNKIPASGWNIEAKNLSINLNLPPSWKLITVLGASSASHAWMDSWSLLQIFLCFLIVLSSYKLIGLTFSILIATCIVLNHNEFLAPQMLYIHLLVLIVWDKLISNRESIYSTICDILLTATFLLLTFQTLSFAKLQFTQMLFPQLQAGTRYRSFMQEIFSALDSAPFVWPSIIFFVGLLILWLTRLSILKGFKSKFFCTFKYAAIGVIALPIITALIALQSTSMFTPNIRATSVSKIAAYDSKDVYGGGFSPSGKKQLDRDLAQNQIRKEALNKNLASGPAVPSWHWRKHQIRVDLPVVSNHYIQIITLSHQAVRIICALRVLLILYVLFLLFKKIFKKEDSFFLEVVKKSMALRKDLRVSSLVFLIIFSVNNAEAEIPSSKTLDSLKVVLESKLCQEKDCANIESLNLRVSKNSFNLKIESNSHGRSLVPLPGPLDVLNPQTIFINGEKSNTILSKNKYLFIGTRSGRNSIEVTGEIHSASAFSLSFLKKPIHSTISSDYWYVEGLSKNGALKGDLRFTEINKNSGIAVNKDERLRPKIDLPPYAVVTRDIYISEEIQINTTVKLLGERSKEKYLKVPLLENEKITSGKLKVSSNNVNLKFSPGEQVKNYLSLINKPVNKWTLKGSKNKNLSEKWKISCSTMLSCSYSGIKPTSNLQGGKVIRLFEPFSDETVSVEIMELDSIKGDSRTIDAVDHSLVWGTGLISGEAKIKTRVTEQSNLKFELEDGFSIKNISTGKNGAKGVFHGSKGEILLSPGSHQVVMNYKSSAKPTFVQKLPAIKINSDASNLAINLKPGEERWILATGGPLWGPCVVFWSKLIVFLIICLSLSKFNLIPLSYLNAVLLGIGLTSLPVIIFWIPLAWLGSLILLDRYRDKISSRFYKKIIISLCVLVVLSLSVLYQVLMSGLVLKPPMLIIGNQSNASILKWYVDHSSGELSRPWVASLPISFWRVFSLFWSLWLVTFLFSWLKRSVELVKIFSKKD